MSIFILHSLHECGPIKTLEFYTLINFIFDLENESSSINKHESKSLYIFASPNYNTLLFAINKLSIVEFLILNINYPLSAKF